MSGVASNSLLTKPPNPYPLPQRGARELRRAVVGQAREGGLQHLAQTSGFTLLEILLALAILALVLSSLFGAYSETITATELVEASREVDHTAARLTMAQMADDLKSLYQQEVKGDPKDSPYRFQGGIAESFGKIDILVNNAGFAIYGTVTNLTIKEIESQMQTNYLGMIYCTKNFLPILQKQNSGHIVNVASVAGSFGLPGIAPYCASKFAMLGFSEGLKHELKGTKVGVTVVSPIMVRTDFFDHPSFNMMPKYSPTSLDPKTVASAIIRASESSRLEVIVPNIVRIGVSLKHTVPFVINPIMGAAFRKLQK